MHLSYEYGEFDTGGNIDETKNAGNIVRQTINFDGLSNPFVQTRMKRGRAFIIAILSTASPYSSAILGVDSLNRLNRRRRASRPPAARSRCRGSRPSSLTATAIGI